MNNTPVIQILATPSGVRELSVVVTDNQAGLRLCEAVLPAIEMLNAALKAIEDATDDRDTRKEEE